MAVNSSTKVQNTTKKGGILNFFRDIKGEVKRITWPTKDETKKAIIAVAVATVLYTVVVGGFDYIFQNLFEAILKLK